MKYLILAIIAVTASCAPKVMPTTHVVSEVHQVVPVAPRAAVVNAKVADAQVMSGELRTGITKALDEADRLRKQRSANEAELVNMWEILTKEKDNSNNLFNQLADTKRESAILAADTVMKDVEATQLRQANDTLQSQVTNAVRNEQINSDRIEKLGKKAAVYDFLKNWVIWTIVVLFVLAILYTAVRYWPAIAMKVAKPI